MPWTNSDGLTIYFANEEGTDLGNGGEYKTFGLEREIEITVNLADLTETEAVISRVVFPHGKVLSKVEIITDTPAATGVAIDVGFKRQVAGTVISATGAAAAFPTASMNVEGERTELVVGSTYAGALIGQVVEADDVALITASRTTATAFTAGRIRLKLFWYKKTPTT